MGRSDKIGTAPLVNDQEGKGRYNYEDSNNAAAAAASAHLSSITQVLACQCLLPTEARSPPLAPQRRKGPSVREISYRSIGRPPPINRGRGATTHDSKT